MAREPDGDSDAAFETELWDGETLADEFHVGDAAVAVTDRRLLVRDAGRVRAVDLTNVRTVRERTLEDRGALLSALQWASLGAFLLAAWRLAPLDALVQPVEPPPGGGFESLYAAVQLLVEALRYVDEAFLAVGLLAIAWAVRQVVGYARERREVLEVDVAGADPVRLPPPEDPTVVDRLRGAVRSHGEADRA